MAKKKMPQSMTDHITRFMSLLDSQVAREMQRSPAERAERGVQKWEPYRKRVELIASHVIEEFGNNNIELDSLLIVAEAFPKVLRILIEELGAKGLGELRSAYCQEVMSALERDYLESKQVLGGDISTN